MKRYLVFLALCFFLTAPTHSQIIDLEKDQLWVDIGFGVLETYGVTEINFNLGLNLVSGSILYKIRTLINTEFDLFGPTPSEEFYSLGALIGKGFSTDYIHIYFSGGIGITGGVKRGEYLYTEPSSGWLDIGDGRNYERDVFVTPSIPLEVDLLLKPTKFLGAGISVFVDLNLKRPLYGFSVKLGLGKLR